MARFKDGLMRKLPSNLKKRPSEAQIQAAILEYLSINKIGSFDRTSNHALWDERFGGYRRPNKYSRKGMCDIVGCYKGRFIGIEIKTESEYKSVMRFWNKVNESGGPDLFIAENKRDEHFLNQIKYITDKNIEGGFCFFTYGIDHMMNKLKEVM